MLDKWYYDSFIVFSLSLFMEATMGLSLEQLAMLLGANFQIVSGYPSFLLEISSVMIVAENWM